MSAFHTMTSSRSADVVVVGGGTVGAWTAVLLAESGVPHVVLLDAATLGEGASSRAAGMVRAQGGTGLLFANGGFATHNHTIAVSSQPIAAASFPRSYDFQAEADALRGAIPAQDRDYAGPATLETYTVFYGRDGQPRSGVVVARTPDGKRTLGHVPGSDEATLARLTASDGDPVGAAGTIGAGDPLNLWAFA